MKKYIVFISILSSMVISISSLQAEELSPTPQSNTEAAICTARQTFQLRLIKDPHLSGEWCLYDRKQRRLYPIHKSSALALQRVAAGQGSIQQAYFNSNGLIININGETQLIVIECGSNRQIRNKKCLVIKQSRRPDITYYIPQ